jgi:hypothetical protein
VPGVESCVWQSRRCWRCDGYTACQTCIKALAGAGRLHVRQLLFPRDVEIRSSPRIGSAARVVRPGPRTSRSLDLSCEAETCRARFL